MFNVFLSLLTLSGLYNFVYFAETINARKIIYTYPDVTDGILTACRDSPGKSRGVSHVLLVLLGTYGCLCIELSMYFYGVGHERADGSLLGAVQSKTVFKP